MKQLEKVVRAEIRSWGPPLSTSALAACAIDLTRRLGEEDLGPSAAASLHKELRGYLADLRKLAPQAAKDDAVDQVTARREARRAAAGMA